MEYISLILVFIGSAIFGYYVGKSHKEEKQLDKLTYGKTYNNVLVNCDDSLIKFARKQK